uniref:interleukin-12 receptor subunit beta-2 n=1 Tax=Doryrhamphus excisus TaxID=161450 RepID=UPI0025AE0077|nr:interleukin-12 receptor subunit beta-2 [Doryrhamphus excisus]XP_057929340.1 interleukin-12 receptor subunit beta-2 [Doryrhamphus excisus]
MAAGSPSWSTVSVLTLLPLLHLWTGETSCVIWSSAGTVIRRGSSLDVYCTFDCECGRSMYEGHPPAPQRYTVVNSSTTRLRVANVGEDGTYSCRCACPPTPDPCGLDIRTGYPPERPEEVSCVYQVRSNETGLLLCRWERGRRSHLQDTTELRLTSVPEERPHPPYRSSVGGDTWATFNVSEEVRRVSVWVHIRNALGTSESKPSNYTLSDIAMPPAPHLRGAVCSSRTCDITVQQSVRTAHLEVQYAADREHIVWSACPHAQGHMGRDQVWSISFLDPYRLYSFRARAKFSTGLWSEWSAIISTWTQEEVPAKEMDVWYAQTSSNFTYITIFWKVMNISEARGKILKYRVSVYSAKSRLRFTASLGANVTNASVPFCARCQAALCAINSKGRSPPANITAYHAKPFPHFHVKAQAAQHSVALWWNKPERAAAQVVVEWYREGLKMQEMQWLRLEGGAYHAIITGLKPSECYQAAIHVFHQDSSVTTSNLQLLNFSQSVPRVGPSFQQEVEGNKVKVQWAELPRGERGGCVLKYTVYLEDSTGHVQPYACHASRRTYVSKELRPGVHRMWMTAWTSRGQGPAGQRVNFIIQSAEKFPAFPLVGCILSMVSVVLMCVCCQVSAVKKRLRGILQRFLFKVPDPANSNWAKECNQVKGEKNHLSEAIMAEEEEEDFIMEAEEDCDVELQEDFIMELQEEPGVNMDVPPPTGQDTPITTYIKTYCSSSQNTHTSMESNATVDYGSSKHQHDLLHQDHQDHEDQFAQMLTLLPDFDSFTQTHQLTLDTVHVRRNTLCEYT